MIPGEQRIVLMSEISSNAITIHPASQIDIRQAIDHNIQRGNPDLAILIFLHHDVISTCRLHVHLTITSGRTESPLQIHEVANQLHLTYGSEVPPCSLRQQLADLLVDLGMTVKDLVVRLVHDYILSIGLRDDSFAFGAVSLTKDAEEVVVSELVGSGGGDDCGLRGHVGKLDRLWVV